MTRRVAMLMGVTASSSIFLLLALSCDGESAPPAGVAVAGGGASTASASSSAASGGRGGDGGPIIEADCQDGWCRIPAGTFTIGSPESEFGHPPFAETQVEVTLTRSFLIGQHEVTQAEWQARGLQDPSVDYTSNAGEGNCIAGECPVGNINWFEAAAYANEVSKAEGFAECYQFSNCVRSVGDDMECTGLTLSSPTVYDCTGYRLPTEAEWEYAARAGTTTAIYSGEVPDFPSVNECYAHAQLEAIAWYCVTGDNHSHPIGQLAPNGWGLYDMIGNQAEWVHSVFSGNGYGAGPLVDPGGDAGSVEPTTARPIRGCAYGLWNSMCRAADRLNASVGLTSTIHGLRLARTLGD